MNNQKPMIFESHPELRHALEENPDVFIEEMVSELKSDRYAYGKPQMVDEITGSSEFTDNLSPMHGVVVKLHGAICQVGNEPPEQPEVSEKQLAERARLEALPNFNNRLLKGHNETIRLWQATHRPQEILD